MNILRLIVLANMANQQRSIYSEELKDREGYLPIQLNFQGIDQKWLQSDASFAQMFMEEITNFFEYSHPEVLSFINETKETIQDMNSLSKFITYLTHRTNKKLILLIDEVDASSNYESFLSFLGMLRTKFLARMQPHHATFYSIVLA